MATTDFDPQARLELEEAAALNGAGGHARLDSQLPTVIWLTGRSGAGKSTIAAIIERRLRAEHRGVGMIDGDDLRSGLCGDLGFCQADRDENVRRAAEVASLMARAGLIVIVSLISPFAEGRAAARALFEPGEFFEVYVDTSLEVAEWRDPKGLYRRARQGKIPQFTGIDSPYEVPRAPELRLDTVAHGPEQCAELVISTLVGAGRLSD